MSKLWSGRFAKSGAQLLDEFNASLPFDKKLYDEDIKGSIAHASMLAKQNRRRNRNLVYHSLPENLGT